MANHSQLLHIQHQMGLVAKSNQPDNGLRLTQRNLNSYAWGQNTNPSKHRPNSLQKIYFHNTLAHSKIMCIQRYVS